MGYQEGKLSKRKLDKRKQNVWKKGARRKLHGSSIGQLKERIFFVCLFAYPFIKYKLQKPQTALSRSHHKGQAEYLESKSLDSRYILAQAGTPMTTIKKTSATQNQHSDRNNLQFSNMILQITFYRPINQQKHFPNIQISIAL